MMLNVLSQDDIEQIHLGSLKILEETGIWFHEAPEVTALLKEHGCQVEGSRVRFPRKLVEQSLRLIPDREKLKIWFVSYQDKLGIRKGENHVQLIGNAYYLYEYEAKHARDCREADYEDKWLVVDNLKNIEGDHCALVVDVLRGLAAARDYSTPDACTAYLYRRVRDQAAVKLARPGIGNLPVHTGFWGQGEDETRLAQLAHMIVHGNAVTEDYWARSNQAFVWCNPISPLQYNPEESKNIMKVARDTQGRPRVMIIAPEIMLGATGPVTIAGALVQHNAEVLAGTVLAQLAGPGAVVIYGCVSAVMDMRAAQISLGSFETQLIQAASVQLADRYGMPSRIVTGNTSAREPGVRAAVEQMVGLYAGMAAGGTFITTGLLDSTTTLSFEHLILLDEMIPHVRSMVQGFKVDDIGPAIAEIQEHGHPSPGFISSDYTRMNMKRDIVYSDYMGRTEKSYEDWYEKAHRKVKDIFSQREAAEPLSKEMLSRIGAVEARLKEDMETWRAGGEGWWRPYVKDLS